MRYYCYKCKSEIIVPIGFIPPGHCECYNEDNETCGDQWVELPDYETPQQYEKRTGKELMCDAAVYYRYPRKHIDPTTKQETGEIRWSRWLVSDYHIMGGLGAKKYEIVVCQSPNHRQMIGSQRQVNNGIK